MDLHLSLFSLVLFLIGAGVASFSSVVGGGAILIVPLFTFLGLSLPAAIATMRLSSVIQQLVSVAAFVKEHLIEWKSALWVALWTMPGAYFGARIVIDIDQKLLSYSISFLMVVLVIGSFFLDRKRLKKTRKKRPVFVYRWPVLAVVGLLMGVYGGFYGAGYSTVLMLFFVLTGGLNFLQGSGNASVATFFMSIVSSIVFFKANLIDWSIFLPVTAGGVVGSWFGVEYAAKFGFGWVRFLLIIVVALSILKLIVYG